MATVASLVVKMAADTSEIRRGVDQTVTMLNRIDDSTKGINTRMVAFGSAIGSAIGNIAAVAVRKLASEVVELATNGIKLAPVVTSFERLTASIGESSSVMLTTTRTATKGLITNLDIMAASNKAILLGLPVTSSEMGVLGQAAVALGRAMKQDAGKSLDDLITALGRSSPLILDNLGLTVKVGEANEQYAQQVGKTSSQLTDAEKKLAFYTAAMEAAKQKTEELGGIQLTLVDQIQRVRVQFTNFTDGLGVAIARSPVLAVAFGGVADSLEHAFGGNQVQRIQTLIGIVNSFAIGVVDAARTGLEAARVLSNIWTGLKVVFAAVGVAVVAVAEGFATAIAAIVSAASRIPGVGAAFNGVAAQMEDARVVLNAMRKDYQAQIGAALDSGNAQNAAIDKVKTALVAMRAKMVDASKAQVDSATIAEVLTTKHRALAGATEATSAATKALEKDAKAFAKAAQEASFSVRRLVLDAGAVPPAIQSAGDSLEAYNIIVGHGVEALIAHSEATKAADLELQKLGMSMPNLAIQSENLSNTVQGSFSEWRSSIADLSRGFEQLATIAGTSLSGIARGIGTVVGALDLASKASDVFKGGLESWRAGERTQGFVGMASGIMSIGSAFMSATSSSSKFQNTVGGAALGAELGAKFGGAWGAAFGAAIGGVAGFLRSAFGPSKEELAGRAVAGEFRAALETALNLQQKLEAGGERWKMSVIALRDAYIAVGHTEAEALSVSERLWRAEKDGPEAVKRVIEEISRTLTNNYLPESQRATALSALGWQGLMDLIKTQSGEAFADATLSAQRFREDAVTPIIIPIEADISAALAALAELRSAGSLWQGGQSAKSDQQLLDEFLKNNPGDFDRAAAAIADEHRRAEAMVNVPGTFHQGGVVDFAKWKRAHSGALAMDEVPAILQTGEGVVSRIGMSLLGADGLAALNSGRSPSVSTRGIEERLDKLATDMDRDRRLRASEIALAVKSVTQIGLRRAG